MKTFEINITVFVQAEHATEALDTLGAELDDVCEADNQVLAVVYPCASDVKEES
jgi:hypothetical protein